VYNADGREAILDSVLSRVSDLMSDTSKQIIKGDIVVTDALYNSMESMKSKSSDSDETVTVGPVVTQIYHGSGRAIDSSDVSSGSSLERRRNSM